MDENTKFCKYCGQTIPEAAVVCIHCGRQVEEPKTASQSIPQPKIVINNANTNTNANINTNVNTNTNTHRDRRDPRQRSKWAAFFLCLFLGFIGAHKFYEGKHFAGILYLLTGGLLGIGWLIDSLILLFKPNPYYV